MLQTILVGITIIVKIFFGIAQKYLVLGEIGLRVAGHRSRNGNPS
jgi:hypothetical protein